MPLLDASRDPGVGREARSCGALAPSTTRPCAGSTLRARLMGVCNWARVRLDTRMTADGNACGGISPKYAQTTPR